MIKWVIMTNLSDRIGKVKIKIGFSPIVGFFIGVVRSFFGIKYVISFFVYLFAEFKKECSL